MNKKQFELYMAQKEKLNKELILQLYTIALMFIGILNLTLNWAVYIFILLILIQCARTMIRFKKFLKLKDEYL